jgi:hypothetical protein
MSLERYVGVQNASHASRRRISSCYQREGCFSHPISLTDILNFLLYSFL